MAGLRVSRSILAAEGGARGAPAGFVRDALAVRNRCQGDGGQRALHDEGVLAVGVVARAAAQHLVAEGRIQRLGPGVCGTYFQRARARPQVAGVVGHAGEQHPSDAVTAPRGIRRPPSESADRHRPPSRRHSPPAAPRRKAASSGPRRRRPTIPGRRGPARRPRASRSTHRFPSRPPPGPPHRPHDTHRAACRRCPRRWPGRWRWPCRSWSRAREPRLPARPPSARARRCRSFSSASDRRVYTGRAKAGSWRSASKGSHSPARHAARKRQQEARARRRPERLGQKARSRLR